MTVKDMRKALISLEKRECKLKRKSEAFTKKEIKFWRDMSDEKIKTWYKSIFQ